MDMVCILYKASEHIMEYAGKAALMQTAWRFKVVVFVGFRIIEQYEAHMNC